MESTPLTVDRMDLADFIDRAVTESPDREEWQRLIVNHYRDEAMEEARRVCVRLLGIKANGDPRRLEPEDAARLRDVAASLR